MDENRKTRYRLLSEKVIKGLRSRQMEGYYAETREDACKMALSMIPEGSVIGSGGSKSVEEIGLLDAVKAGNYDFADRSSGKTPEEKRAIETRIFTSDYYLCSSNAVTEDGILVNLDGNSNRVSSIAYGPDYVIMIVGINKVVRDVDAALSRVRNEAAPINAQRFPIDTPCKVTGSCSDCKSKDTICCQMLITRFERHPGRIKVILVGEELGF